MLPTFYKKILRCYITLEIDYNLTSSDINSQILDKIMSKYSNLSALHSGVFKTNNFKDQIRRLYRIMDKDENLCLKTYSKINLTLIDEIPEANMVIIKDIKTKARIITFYLVNNVILFILLSGIYFLFSEKVSLKVRIKKN